MSEFKRYTESCMEGGGVFESKDGEFVDYSTYAGAQYELSALREELADLKSSVSTWRIAYDRRTEERDELQQRLTAAEQRNEHYVWLLDTVINRGDYPWPVLHEQITNTLAALKPTESGVSE